MGTSFKLLCSVSLVHSVHLEVPFSGFPMMTTMCTLLCLLVLTSILFHLRVDAALSNQSSLRPPEGNRIELVVTAKGFQIYSCNYSSHTWSLDRAEAILYGTINDSVNTIGYHYFLPRPDSNGGRATFALQSPEQQIPESTVTGKVLVNRPSSKPGSIDHLLLEATSHSGHGRLSGVSYVQRLATSGGAAPSSRLCRVNGKRRSVEYQAEYVFWKQQNAPADSTTFVYFAEGFQHYTFNGSDWSLTNVNALLSPLPGDPVVGRHYFDAKGLPTWETTAPLYSSVTAKAIKVTKPPTETSISWLNLKAVSTSGDRHLLGSVDRVQRRSTRGGVKPTALQTPSPAKGDEFRSPYSAVYWFRASDP